MTYEEADENRHQLERFYNYWVKRKGRLERRGDGSVICRAKVRYEFQQNRKLKIVRETTYVAIMRNVGLYPGTITVEESGSLLADFLHLEFSPDFQRYRFRKPNNALWIRGDESKMKGPYKVRIRPLKLAAN